MSQIRQTDVLRDNLVRLVEVYYQDTSGKQKLSSHIYVNEKGGYDHETRFRNGTTSDTLSRMFYAYNTLDKITEIKSVSHGDSLFDFIETYAYDSSGRCVLWETTYPNKSEFNEKSCLRHDTMFHYKNGELLNWFIVKNRRRKSVQLHYENGKKNGRVVERFYNGVRKRVHRRKSKGSGYVVKTFTNSNNQLVKIKAKNKSKIDSDDQRLKRRHKYRNVEIIEYLESGLISSIHYSHLSNSSIEHSSTVYKYVFRE